MFASVICEIRRHSRKCTVEVLVPDFQGKRSSLSLVLNAGPDIFAHNVGTVPRLYAQVRPQARYDRSLEVIRNAKQEDRRPLTKSGFLVGLGERGKDLHRVMEDLREVSCDILTIGQYHRPTRRHQPVVSYYTPRESLSLKKVGLDMGFLWVESGPLVRSYDRNSQTKILNAGLDKIID